ncbi:MAG: hypothetical protein Kow00114_12730 [Kiloniellaceae bacterium]
MSLKFTLRKPKPRPAAVAPLAPAEAPKAQLPQAAEQPAAKPADKPKELGGPSEPEPTRYGDWERKGICVDF